MEDDPKILREARKMVVILYECLIMNKCTKRISILAVGNLLLQIYKGVGASPEEVKMSLDGMLILYNNLIEKIIEK